MTMYKVKQADGGTLSDAAVQILKELLNRNIADAVMVSAENPWSRLPMPTVFTDPEKMERVVPLAPSSAVSYAREASLLVREPSDKKVALVMKPCEVRAYVELVKLNQCNLDNAILISMDCSGRLENKKYVARAEEQPDLSCSPAPQDLITESCASCDVFLPDGVDLQFCTMGMESGVLGIAAGTAKGGKIASELGLLKEDAPSSRAEVLSDLKEKRSELKRVLFDRTSSMLKSIEEFQAYIGRCINCYNCRSACPVCYCRECVFLTDVFDWPADMLIERAKRRGQVKMPTDTTMFHMTRLSHIAHACVGCGQCTSACPSDISVADMFRTVAEKIQDHFDYIPGRDVNEPIPQLVVRKGKSQE